MWHLQFAIYNSPSEANGNFSSSASRNIALIYGYDCLRWTSFFSPDFREDLEQNYLHWQNLTDLSLSLFSLVWKTFQNYLVFKGLPSLGQNQFWRDGLKMWMKASIGFCPQRADLILLTDEVRGRAGFLRPRESRPTKVVRRLIFITLEERFQNLSHKYPPRTFI